MKKLIALSTAVCILCGMLSACAAKRNVVESGDKTTAAAVNNSSQSVPVETVQSGDDVSNQPEVTDAASGIVSGTGETATDTSSDTKKYTLEDIDGWWYHIGEKISGSEPVVEVIFVDASSGTWTEYSRYGVAGSTYTCSIEGDIVSFDYGDIGVTMMSFDGVSLLNVFGYIEYIPGEPIEEIDTSMYEGKWYAFGDTESNYYELGSNAYTLYVGGEAQESGEWKSESTTKTLEDGTIIDELSLTLITAESTNVYLVTEKGSVLYNDENNAAFIHERVIGKAKGDDLVRKYDLICHDWKGVEEGMPTLQFGYYSNKFYLLNEQQGNDGNTNIVKEVGGTWSINDFELNLHYAEGHEEITPYDPETLVFSFYKMSFTKVKN